MPDLGSEWYRAVARMERGDLVDTLEREAELRGEAQREAVRLDMALAEEKRKPKFIIARNYRHAEYACYRMGVPPREVMTIITTDHVRWDKISGRTFNAADGRLVRGWTEGLYALEVQHELLLRGLHSISAVAYAPDPYIDMLEYGEFDEFIRWKKENR